MKDKKILFIVEGEKTEFKLMNHLMNLYYPNNNYYIWSYKTNIHALYSLLETNDSDFSDLDILFVLRSQEKNPVIREKLNEYYSNIVLIFDYDPQDNRFDTKKIEKLMHYFNNSQENGILYLNYPMIEVFKKLNKSSGDTYEYGMITVGDNQKVDDFNLENTVEEHSICRYKEYINRCTSETDWYKYTRAMCDQILVQNLKKYNKIVFGQYRIPKDINNIDLEKTLEVQNKLFKCEQRFYELCTCIFYVLELRNKGFSMENFTEWILSY